MVTIVIGAAIVDAAFHISAGHTHHRYRKAPGLRPRLYLQPRPRLLRLSQAPPAVSASATACKPEGIDESGDLPHRW